MLLALLFLFLAPASSPEWLIGAAPLQPGPCDDNGPHKFTMNIGVVGDGTGETLFDDIAEEDGYLPYENATWIHISAELQKAVGMPYRFGKCVLIEDQQADGFSPLKRKAYTLSRKKPAWFQCFVGDAQMHFFFERDPGIFEDVYQLALTDRAPRPKETLILPPTVVGSKMLPTGNMKIRGFEAQFRDDNGALLERHLFIKP